MSEAPITEPPADEPTPAREPYPVDRPPQPDPGPDYDPGRDPEDMPRLQVRHEPVE